MNLPKNHPSRIRPVRDAEGNCIAIRYQLRRWKPLSALLITAFACAGALFTLQVSAPVLDLFHQNGPESQERWLRIAVTHVWIIVLCLAFVSLRALAEMLRQYPYIRRRTVITFFRDRLEIAAEGQATVEYPWDQLEQVSRFRKRLLFKGCRRVRLPSGFWENEYPLHEDSFRKLLGNLLETPPPLPPLSRYLARELEKKMEALRARLRITRDESDACQSIELPVPWAVVVPSMVLVLVLPASLGWLLYESVFAETIGLLLLLLVMSSCVAPMVLDGVQCVRCWHFGPGSVLFTAVGMEQRRKKRTLLSLPWENLIRVKRSAAGVHFVFSNSQRVLLPDTFWYVYEATRQDFQELLGMTLEEKREYSFLERLLW